MTRRKVYGLALFALIVASAMTLIAIIVPRWISWNITNVRGRHIHYTYGLHKRCSSLTNTCEPYPQYEDCNGRNRYFCFMWRTVGFLMSFAVVLEGLTLVTYITVLIGGRKTRETGWKLLTTLLFITGAVQCAAMAIVAYQFTHDEKFFAGWKLDLSWFLCIISWSVLVLSAVGVGLSAYILPPEGGYELIPNS